VREHVVTDHLAERITYARKAKRTAFAIFMGALLLAALSPSWWPVSFLFGFPALIAGMRISDDYCTYEDGWDGEMLFRQRLAGLALPDSWTAWYGVPAGRNAKGKIIDTDCILLGPGGLFAFEVKHYTGFTVCADGRWERLKVGRMGTPYRGRIGSPSGQLAHNLMSLKEWIEGTGGKAPWIQGYVVFTNGRGRLHAQAMRHLKAIEVDLLAEVIPQGSKILDDEALAALADAVRTYCGRPV
jgi:hypothetical protein